MKTLPDQLTETLTAFPSFRALLAAPGYVPSLCPRPRGKRENAERRMLADLYDLAQEAQGDSRRAFRG